MQLNRFYHTATLLPNGLVLAAGGEGSSGVATNTTELSNVIFFTVGAAGNAVPAITQLSPASEPAGSAAFTLTVAGTGFVSGAVVNWNGTPRTTTFGSATSLTAAISAADVMTAGTAKVSVFNPAPGGGSSPSQIFTITSSGAAVSGGGSAVATTASAQSSSAAASADLRFIAFAMASTDGITERPGTTQNVFLRDTCEGAPTGCVPSTTLESIGIDGHAGNGDSTSPSISADGRYIAFVSSATTLVDPDVNDVADVFVRDTCAGAPQGCVPSTQLASIAGDGSHQANGASESASINATGRYITFRSSATNLDPAFSGSAGASAIFLRDTCAGATAGCVPSTQRLNLQ